MKKFLFVFAFVLASITANAQFEQGKWMINSSLTTFDMSFKSGDNHLGFMAEGGYLLKDNIAVIGTLGGDWKSGKDVYTIGAKARYYFSKVGFFAGAGLQYQNIQFSHAGSDNSFGLKLEGGYAFFLGQSFSIEPAVYYDLSFTDSDYSRFGLKLGFSYYF